MIKSEDELLTEVEAAGRIEIIPALLDVICRTTGMGFAAVARVTEHRWVACEVLDNVEFGLKAKDELKIETTICNEIRQHHKAVIIDHVDEDQGFCNHPVPQMYGFQSYISVPVYLRDGRFFGTICSLDPKPARLNKPEVISMFSLFADLLSFHLSAIDELNTAHNKISEQEKATELREQFIAILGHDLKNPLTAILSSASYLRQQALDSDLLKMTDLIKSSSVRAIELIDNVQDFAQGHLGGGIHVNRSYCQTLGNELLSCVSELISVYPDQPISTTIDIDKPVYCDKYRINQVVSNLVTNAIKHGEERKPVSIKARISQGLLEIVIRNKGNKIPAEEQAKLFEPFVRGKDRRGANRGLGLGLYISSMIAEAHGGGLSVSSTDKATEFRVTIPVDGSPSALPEKE
ncbi:MAG: GAF domain-containing sensor histidine kinase [Cyclobacteriaceae bacterium]